MIKRFCGRWQDRVATLKSVADRFSHFQGSDEIPNDGLAHEAAHAMARIRDGHLESDVVTLDASMQTMRLLDDARAQVGVVYPSETHPSETHPSER